MTSFYRSTPQTSRLPLRVRQKGALLRSTGKLPYQSNIPHKHELNCFGTTSTSHGENLLVFNCLPRKSKVVQIAQIVIDLLRNNVFWT